MPYLNLEIGRRGPVVDVSVGISRKQQEDLAASGLDSPSPILISALVDTGASRTCVDSAVLKELGLVAKELVPVLTPSTAGQPHLTGYYAVSMSLLHPKLTYSFYSVPVLESDFTGQGIGALIGRDLLAKCLLVYDGQAGVFTLAF
jgi:hypothetical protein